MKPHGFNFNKRPKPIQGQRDPYLSMDSTISYQDNPNGDIQNIYNLEGALTGCDKNTLNDLRDDLVRSLTGKKIQQYLQILKYQGYIKQFKSQINTNFNKF